MVGVVELVECGCWVGRWELVCWLRLVVCLVVIGCWMFRVV